LPPPKLIFRECIRKSIRKIHLEAIAKPAHLVQVMAGRVVVEVSIKEPKKATMAIIRNHILAKIRI
jgi:hypothetical protein